MEFLKAFIPLFVAIDPFGAVPVLMGLTNDMEERHRRKVIFQATFTALAVALAFLFLGEKLFLFLGITGDDFRIGGGIILLALAVYDLASPEPARRRLADPTVGAVPIGVPLIAGPASLTTMLILLDAFGYVLTLASLLVNVAVVYVVFRFGAPILRIVGRPGLRAISKVVMLFLAAIAVMMIRHGVQGFLRG